MDETINKETVSGEAGAEETPTSQPSETQAAPSAVDVESLKGILEPLVKDAFERQQQSLKDKRLAKQESRISSLEDTLAQLKELKDEGLSEKFAIQFLEMREKLGSQGEEPSSEALPKEEQATQPTVAADALLSSALTQTGLDINDAGVIDILRNNPGDTVKQILEVSQLAESRKQAQATPASPGATLSTGGGQTVQGESLESVTEQLEAEMAKPIKDFKRLQELQKKHAELLPKQ